MFVEAFMINTDTCAEKLQNWRRFGKNISIIDLFSAYMQLKIDKKPWANQAVVFCGQGFYLTQLGFRLNNAPIIMKAVLDKALSQNRKIWNSTSS